MLFPRSALILCALACATPPTFARTSDPITVVVPFAPGASADVTMRAIAQKLTEQSGQTVIVENRSGGGGIIGAEAVKSSAGRGTMLYQSNIGSHGINPSLYGDRLTYDAIKDFKSVSLLWRFPSVLAVSSQSQARDVASLIKLASEKNLTYGSAGTGSSGHLLGAMLSEATGKPMTHIPYRGAAPAIVDLAANRIDFFFVSYSSIRKLVEDGRLRVLAVASDKRMKLLPDIPTLAERNVNGVVVDSWFGVSAPAGTDDATIDRLHKLFATAARDPEIVRKLESDGVEAVGSTPLEYDAVIKTDIERLGSVVRRIGVTPE